MGPQKRKAFNKEYVTFITKFYPLNPQNEVEKFIDIIHSVMESARNNKLSIYEILEKTGRIIHRSFGFREIGIGLKSRKDGLYRYEYLFGFRPDIEKNYRNVEYTHQEMTSQEKFPYIRIGKYAELDPLEGFPEEEIALLNRPAIFNRTRENYEDFLEGDYMNILMHGNNNELIGWMDLSLTPDGKLPPRTTIRWIELLANICGLIIQKKWIEEDKYRKR